MIQTGCLQLSLALSPLIIHPFDYSFVPWYSFAKCGISECRYVRPSWTLCVIL